MMDSETYEKINSEVRNGYTERGSDVEHAVRALESQDHEEKVRGACTLSYAADSNPGAIAGYVEELASSLEEDSVYVRRNVVIALTRLAELDVGFVEPLVGSPGFETVMLDPRPGVSLYGVSILNELSKEDPLAGIPYQDVLFDSMETDHGPLKRMSLRVVRRSAHGEKMDVDRERIENVSKFLNEESRAKIFDACVVLAKFADRGHELPDLSHKLEPLISSDDDFIRRKTIGGLDALAINAPRAVGGVIDLLPKIVADRDERVSQHALTLLISVSIRIPSHVGDRDGFRSVIENELRTCGDPELQSYMRQALDNLDVEEGTDGFW
ncbi:MAG: hypothetical protein ABEK59_10395 [Halobacteria archaeon]